MINLLLNFFKANYERSKDANVKDNIACIDDTKLSEMYLQFRRQN